MLSFSFTNKIFYFHEKRKKNIKNVFGKLGIFKNIHNYKKKG